MAEKLLLVDDDQQMRNLIGSMLQRKGFDVIEASCGTEAIGIMENQSFDTVITDMHMPLLSGNDVAKAAKKANPEAKIILCYARNKIEPEPGLYDEIFLKPLIFKNLFDALLSF